MGRTRARQPLATASNHFWVGYRASVLGQCSSVRNRNGRGCGFTLSSRAALTSPSLSGEGGHRTEAFGIGFELIESITDLVNDLIEGCKGQIRQLFFAQLFPHMFYWIDLWTVGRLSNQSHICWDLEIF